MSHPDEDKYTYVVALYWTFGLNTAEIAERINLAESRVYRVLWRWLEREKGVAQNHHALPAIGQSPVAHE